MKIAEAVFEIAYLILAVGCGILLVRRGRGPVRTTGVAALVLGLGDAFHLVPRIFDAFQPGIDRTAALGAGKLVTSCTMTLFYLILEWYRQDRYGEAGTARGKSRERIMLALAAVRIALCLFPQNAWTQADPPMLWGVIRNVPFAAMGVLTVLYWAKSAKGDRVYRLLPAAVTLSFLFYLPVVVLAGTHKIVGMLMLPKTVMYVWILVMFIRAARERKNA
ncbi:MAG: hypothetical protein IKP10_07965 [Clostridia bacterium]|nr:hypothetical protein [Clostridia bacterium]